MSPAPINNDPGNDDGGDEIHGMDVPPVNLMAVIESSSDDEDEQEDHMEPGNIGYQLLTPGFDLQGPAGPGDDSDDEDNNDGHGDATGDTNSEQMHPANADMPDDGLSGAETNARNHHPMPHLQVPPLGENQELKELRELWKTPRVTSEEMSLDQDKVDTIKTAMAGFNLPMSSLPDWATVVPETEWKAQLLSRLGAGKCAAILGDSKCKKFTETAEQVTNSTHSTTTATPQHSDLGSESAVSSRDDS